MDVTPPTRSSTAGDGPGGLLPLSVDELFQRCMGNVAVATLLLEKFEKQVKEDLREIEHRLAAMDAGQVARTAHTLKGAAGAVAAASLRERAAKVEVLARENRLDAIAGELSALRTEVERCLSCLPVARGALASAARGGGPGTENTP